MQWSISYDEEGEIISAVISGQVSVDGLETLTVERTSLAMQHNTEKFLPESF